MEERIKQLEDKVDKLIKVIKYLSDKLDTHLDSTTKVSKVEIPSKLISNQQLRISKDRVFLQSILEKTTNPSSQKFLQSIINNNYDTLTVKQKQVVDEIVNQL